MLREAGLGQECQWQTRRIWLAGGLFRPLRHPACVEAVKRERANVRIRSVKKMEFPGLTEDDIQEALAEGAEDRRKAERAQAGLTDDEDDAWPEGV
jgi:hypothetical protein